MYNPVFTVLSRIMDNDKLKGFLVVNDVGIVQPVKIESIQAVGRNAKYTNAVYDEQYKTLNGTQGSLTTYPSINTNYALISKGGVIVLATILDASSKEPIGVVAYDGLGTRYNISFRKLDELLRTNTACNFKLINKGTSIVAVQKDNTAFPTIEMQTKKKSDKIYHSAKGESKPVEVIDNGSTMLPELRVYSFDFIKTSEFGESAATKLTQAGINMKLLTPYYYTMYQTISKKPVIGFGTMGVTEDTLYYDIQFVASLSVAQLTFVIIHEMLHIAMQHSIRFGSRRNHDLWNIATDLYINSIICHDFGVTYGAGETEIRVTSGNANSDTAPLKQKKAVIQTPNEGIFLETIGETLDLARDMPENIYDRLVKENPNYGKSSSSGNPQNSKSSNSSGEGQSSSSNNQQGNESGNSEGTQSNSESSSQQGSGGNGSDSSSDNSSTEGKSSSGSSGNDLFDNNSENMSKDGTDDLSNDSSETKEGSNVKTVSVVYNGKKLTGTIMSDIMTNNSSTTDAAKQANVDSSKSALQRMSTKIKLAEEESGQKLSKNAGVGASLAERYIEFGLSATIRWQDILRNMCKKSPKKIFTLAQPNVDYMNMGMTIASRRAIGKPTRLTGIKFCIDVSGSVTKEELNFFLSEVNNIMTHFDVEGELIYWSTMVGDAGLFSSLRDLLKVEPHTTGGTSVRCVFDYLSGKTKVKNKKEPDRMRDIEAVFIITDGYFNNDYEDYAKDFGRKTYWLITGNPISFIPPFGKVIGIGKNK